MKLWVHILICTWPSLIKIKTQFSCLQLRIHKWSQNVYYMYDRWLTADVFANALKKRFKRVPECKHNWSDT